MLHKKSEIDQSADNLLRFLEENKLTQQFDYPFCSFFPEICCESVSLIFMYLLEEKYGLVDAKIIKGTNKKRHEHHFWVEVGGLIYDLTAHQFAEIDFPIIGERNSPLKKKFKPTAEEPMWDFVDREWVVRLHKADIFNF